MISAIPTKTTEDIDIDLLSAELDVEKIIIRMRKMQNKYSLEYRLLRVKLLDNLNKMYARIQGN
jgi:hypothetical protein